MKENIIVLIVTYNRLELLKECLKKYENLIKKPEKILIVDNNSTDGTKEFLKKWVNIKSIFEKEILFLQENIGGSGGFYSGMDKILKDSSSKYDWIYISDDDAFPKKDLFEKFHNINKEKNIGAICSKVINNGKIDVMHRRRINKKFKENFVLEEEYNKRCFEIDLFSYVGTFIKIDCLKEIGLPEKDYFIWYDDTEHSYRISRKYKILCFPELEVEHNVGEANIGFSWKTYYGIRNRIHMLKKYMSKFEFFIYLLKINYRMKSRFLKKKISKEEYLCFKEAINDAKNGKLGKK
ncbi:glycosyltransferase [Fusobacterium perfoetens]|uniref:glycosyltransferase n=1 Tax=Fusobacterium perfoetens TaxID=852 RepID=UPI00068569C1|nr:glycosyltransferase [Fusobacterium perfoetens]